jgi:hypothetical protein
MKQDPIEHQIHLDLASGAKLTLLFFSDREQRWIFAYDYIGDTKLGKTPDIVNNVRLTLDFEDGELAKTFVLSMHVIIPSRLGKNFFVGMDVSPGAKTYLEFVYEHYKEPYLLDTHRPRVGINLGEYRLAEIRKGARDVVRLPSQDPALMKPVNFPFPVTDRITFESGKIRVPFLTNAGDINVFEVPTCTGR